MSEGSATGAGVTQWVSIAGNIKQQYLPFVLKPKSNLNGNINGDRELTDGPQFFSFRNKKADEYSAGFGRLNVLPSVIRQPDFGLFFDKDISNQLLYDYNSKEKITIDSFFNKIPGVQIREFQVDSKLDQFLNLFYDIFKSAGGIFDDIGKLVKDSEYRKKWIGKLKDTVSAIKDFCTASGPYVNGPNLILDKRGNNRWEHAGSGAFTGAVVGTIIGGPGVGTAVGAAAGAVAADPPIDTFIQSFPFIMYYRLQSCTTTNVYELPCTLDSLWSTDGEAGWMGDNYLALSQFMGEKDGALRKVMSMVTGLGSELIDRVRINYTPRWDAEKGTSTKSAELTVQFDLFNDTAEAAMYNFIFVNTIVPNNMWLQYHMLAHSQCLYDVKIEGVQRLFACAGSFDVKPSGIMRTPTPGWIESLCKKYANAQKGKRNGYYDADVLAQNIIANDLIRIPDVYTITLKFKSLIPQNFNNFLFNYSRNCNMEQYKNKPAHQESVFADVLSGIKSELSSIVETKLKSESEQKQEEAK